MMKAWELEQSRAEGRGGWRRRRRMMGWGDGEVVGIARERKGWRGY